VATARAIDGVPVAYDVTGRGEPTLVFVHGWAFDRHLWDAQVRRFAAERRVVALDLGGHGESGRGRGDWTIPAFGEDVRAVVEALDLRRAVLIGHSMGGPVALEAARRMPDRLAGLVLVDTLLDVENRMPREQFEATVAPFEADFPAAAERFAREWLVLPTTDPALVERIVARVRAMDPAIGVPAIRASWSYDPRPALREIRAPIRAVNAGRFPTNVEGTRRHAPQFEAAIMGGVSHYPMLEDPERFDRLLADALGTF
jgi:pimeloyl-ACP methyl ester carboxylesterase